MLLDEISGIKGEKICIQMTYPNFEVVFALAEPIYRLVDR